MTSAVVFAYHNVGVRCLSVLLAQGVEVKLVVTHQDNPNEKIWFGSVQKLAEHYAIPVITPDSPNTEEVIAQIKACEPDFLFSFYYRHMIAKAVLDIPIRGAFNMHGSLLPKYRGRVPVNWAIIHGETETGATLHVMNEKPDNGALIDQCAIPILPDDTAAHVFDKVTVAAEITLYRCLPGLIAGTAELIKQDLSQGGYFGGRKAEDGRIDWQQSATQIHNLVRAVCDPFPGAFTDTPKGRLIIWQSRVELAAETDSAPVPVTPKLFVEKGKLFARCADGSVLQILRAELNDVALNSRELNAANLSHFFAETEPLL